MSVLHFKKHPNMISYCGINLIEEGKDIFIEPWTDSHRNMSDEYKNMKQCQYCCDEILSINKLYAKHILKHLENKE